MILSEFKTIIRRQLNQNKTVLFVLEIILLAVHYFTSQNLLILRFMLSIASYFLVPVFLVLSVLNITRSFWENPGSLFGFFIQTLIIAIFWGSPHRAG